MPKLAEAMAQPHRRQALSTSLHAIGISAGQRYIDALPCLRGMIVPLGVWRSPVAHLVWDQGVQGSNPCTPTTFHKRAVVDGPFSFPDSLFLPYAFSDCP